MLSLRRPPFRVRTARLLHATPATSRTLIGPPDPVSNLRPVVYNDEGARRRPTRTIVTHPYSLTEFTRAGESDIEYRWRIYREQLDAFNHAFWTDTNTRFNAARDDALASLPPAATLETREAALADLYRRWVLQEAPRQAQYNREFRRRSYVEIKLALRAHWHKLLLRVGARSAANSNWV